MIQIEQLTKSFGDVKAMQGVTLDLKPGLFGLLGPNGAGKSTLMRTMATLQPPDSGTITYEGEDIVQNPNLMRRVLGYLPQDFGVYPRISAQAMLDQIAIMKGIVSKKDRTRVVGQLLEQTNLTHARKKSLSTYSGGMRQRFGIAQALLGDPKLIIVDEPTAGLDPEERNRFHNLLSEIGENVVVILSTHIVEDVADLCPRMAVMNGGRIVSEGAPQELVDQLAGRIWKKAISKTDLADHQQRYTVISTRLSAGQTLIRALADSNPGEGFEPAQPDMEDVYFATLAEHRHTNQTTAQAA